MIFLLWLLAQQPVSTVGTKPVPEPDRPSVLATYCEQHRCELVLHIRATDDELEGPYIYLELRPDVGLPAMCSGAAEGTLVTWLKAHRDQTIVLSMREK